MHVHYLWIGSDKMPYSYHNNLSQCYKLNSTNFNFNVWDDKKCLDLLEEYNMLDYWNNLPTFISKCCMVRYLILDKFGGIYTDFDIWWNKSFTEILNKFYQGADLLLTYNDYSSMIMNNKSQHVLDDPFIFSKPGILKPCVEYCQTRKDLINDGDLYLATGELKQHRLEPVGPFGLTKWVYKFNIKIDSFPQNKYLDQLNGEFGIHDQKTNWKN